MHHNNPRQYLERNGQPLIGIVQMVHPDERVQLNLIYPHLIHWRQDHVDARNELIRLMTVMAEDPEMIQHRILIYQVINILQREVQLALMKRVVSGLVARQRQHFPLWAIRNLEIWLAYANPI